IPPTLSGWVDEKGAGRVLVVDDDPSMLAMVVNTLQSMGYDTIASCSGNDALEVLRSEEKIDLLFTDLVLPGGIDGAALAHMARRVRPGLPVLLTTGFVAVGADA